jgi:penicillin G amidase
MKRLLAVAAGLMATAVVHAQTVPVPRLADNVTVYTDANGIPTIVGETETDVTFVQGYLHAPIAFSRWISAPGGQRHAG